MRKVVLVSLDAFFIADTEHPDPDGFLTRMMREGTFCRRVETIFPALTYPIHVTMVTGCDPNKTGVGQNQPPQPDVPKAERVWYWERKHIQVPTLFEAVKKKRRTKLFHPLARQLPEQVRTLVLSGSASVEK